MKPLFNDYKVLKVYVKGDIIKKGTAFLNSPLASVNW